MAVRDARLEKLRVEYARWMLLDRVTREANGLPTSHAGWAEAKELSPRTLRRWRNDDESFAELLEAEERKAASRLPGGTTQRVGLDRDPDELESVEEARAQGVTDPERLTYLSVKTAIVEKARDGDREALGHYMKWWGHEFVEDEKAQRDRGFGHLSDEQLVAEIERLIGVLRDG